ncbi:hypothetical protein ZOSMA_123G00070 [Zostera marina]|uniref:Uncharacterized protein n=1 Tax=Zostera marina TaxID=29655 RepID=A0A0K9Q0I0_ZOSMR|nr:hypothetical protein ZOSMA_123G00070 [Zostera marina]
MPCFFSSCSSSTFPYGFDLLGVICGILIYNSRLCLRHTRPRPDR